MNSSLLKATAANENSVPVPPSATGQYPDPVWAEVDYGAPAQATAADEDDAPTPPSATGQYPDPVWAKVDYGAPAQATAADEDDAPAPPSATGQYPDPVWAQVDNGELAQASATRDVNPAPPAEATAPPVPLDNQEMYRSIRAVAAGISGDALYEWVDGSQPQQHGLRAGLVGFGQANGDLGRLLEIMRRRDPSLFAVVMGSASDALLRVATAPTRDERLQPVDGRPLWHAEWQEKFRQAGQQETFQAAQNEAAIEHQFRPMLAAARELALRSDRGLALLYDRVAVLGLQVGVEWIRQRLAPPDGVTEAARLQALLEAAGPDRKRLQQVHNSPLLDGTTYDFLQISD